MDNIANLPSSSPSPTVCHSLSRYYMAGSGGDDAGLDRDYEKCGGPSDQDGVKLFGVRLTNQLYKDHVGLMRKSMSMGNLALTQARMCCIPGSVPRLHLAQGAAWQSEHGLVAAAANCGGEQQHGYVSDSPALHLSSSSISHRERKKGVAWTEDEHRLFLAGLQKLGKGDWRGISRSFVTSRTPTQVASHAQKYFLRQVNINKRKRRSSLFDLMSSNNVAITSTVLDHHPQDTMVPTGEFNISTLEHGSSHASGPVSSFMDMFPPYTNYPLPSPPASCVSAELSLGRANMQQWPNVLLSGQLPSLIQDASERDTTTVGMRPAETSCISSSSSRSLSSSLSPSSSFHRIDEASELLRLSLSIGPPSSAKDSSDHLSLKLEQPALSEGRPATSLGTSGISSSTPNAISVV